MNLGRLVSGRPGLVACTPAGCMEILRRGNIPIEGADAVVLGRSDIVGKPMALLLMHANPTAYTIAIPKRATCPEQCAAPTSSSPPWARPAMVCRLDSSGATVIDVGINRVTDAKKPSAFLLISPNASDNFARKASALVGDVHPDAVEVAGRHHSRSPALAL